MREVTHSSQPHLQKSGLNPGNDESCAIWCIVSSRVFCIIREIRRDWREGLFEFEGDEI
jgi:hypothetical protein